MIEGKTSKPAPEKKTFSAYIALSALFFGIGDQAGRLYGNRTARQTLNKLIKLIKLPFLRTLNIGADP